MGGLLALSTSFLNPVIHRLTLSSYLRHATRKLLLLPNREGTINANSQVHTGGDGPFEQIKANLEDKSHDQGGHVSKEDIDNIMESVTNDRRPVRVVSMLFYHRFVAFLQRVFCGCCSRCRDKNFIPLSSKQVKQANRKLSKALDVTNLLKSVQKSDMLQDATLTRDQKLLSLF